MRENGQLAACLAGWWMPVMEARGWGDGGRHGFELSRILVPSCVQFLLHADRVASSGSIVPGKPGPVHASQASTCDGVRRLQHKCDGCQGMKMHHWRRLSTLVIGPAPIYDDHLSLFPSSTTLHPLRMGSVASLILCSLQSSVRRVRRLDDCGKSTAFRSEPATAFPSGHETVQLLHPKHGC